MARLWMNRTLSHTATRAVDTEFDTGHQGLWCEKRVANHIGE